MERCLISRLNACKHFTGFGNISNVASAKMALNPAR
jgi:hypothetical protein